MTEAQKTMKKYMTAIERRLNLPREVKARVMSDLQSSIQSRREAGQTDGEIYAEMGAPAQVAAELNEQMKEYAYEKSPWRWAALGAAVFVLLWGFGRVSARLEAAFYTWMLGLNHSVGIIGGADGPTAIFVTSQWTLAELFPWVLAGLMGLWGFWKLGHLKKETK